jgi:phosphatidylserine/phosphatidylglycerophosphate/cardiolipin synthase-like enzyme
VGLSPHDHPDPGTDAEGQAIPWFPVGADRVRLLRDGKQAFPVMLDAIANAKHEVLLEFYWIGTDGGGRAVSQRPRRAGGRRSEGASHS